MSEKAEKLSHTCIWVPQETWLPVFTELQFLVLYFRVLPERKKENRNSVSRINGIFSITIQQQKANGNKSDWKKKKKVGGELYGVLQKWLL